MAPVKKPVGATKLQVARHNAKQVSPELDAEIKEIGLSLGMTVETLQPNPETSTALLQAIESASEWNSLLLNARAERGPHWDVGTQMFHTDYGSELYYDPTPLIEIQKASTHSSDRPAQGQQQPQQHHQPHHQPFPQQQYQQHQQQHQHQHQQQQHHPHPQMPQMQAHPQPLPPGIDQRFVAEQRAYSGPIRHAQGNPYPSANPVSGAPFPHGQIQPPQFFPDSTGMRMAAQISAQHQEAMMMGMGPMGRRMTRGMGMNIDPSYMSL